MLTTFNPECVTNLEYQSEKIIFESLLTTFEAAGT